MNRPANALQLPGQTLVGGWSHMGMRPVCYCVRCGPGKMRRDSLWLCHRLRSRKPERRGLAGKSQCVFPVQNKKNSGLGVGVGWKATNGTEKGELKWVGGIKNRTELRATTDDVQGQGLVAVSGVLSTGLVVFCLFVVGEARDLGEGKMPAKNVLPRPSSPSPPACVCVSPLLLVPSFRFGSWWDDWLALKITATSAVF